MNELAIRAARLAVVARCRSLSRVVLDRLGDRLGRRDRARAPPPRRRSRRKPVVTALLPEYAIAGGTAARAETVERTLFNPTRRPAPVAGGRRARSRGCSAASSR